MNIFFQFFNQKFSFFNECFPNVFPSIFKLLKILLKLPIPLQTDASFSSPISIKLSSLRNVMMISHQNLTRRAFLVAKRSACGLIVCVNAFQKHSMSSFTSAHPLAQLIIRLLLMKFFFSGRVELGESFLLLYAGILLPRMCVSSFVETTLLLPQIILASLTFSGDNSEGGKWRVLFLRRKMIGEVIWSLLQRTKSENLKFIVITRKLWRKTVK